MYLLSLKSWFTFFNQINKEKDIENLLNEIKELIPSDKINHIIEAVENIISIDGIVTNEEQLLLDIVKKQLN